MEIRYAGTYSEDLIHVDRAIRKALGQPGVYANLGCLALAALILLPLSVSALLKDDTSTGVPFFVLGGAAAVLAVWRFVAFRRSLAKHPSLGLEISGRFDEQGFEIRTPTSESRVAWAALSFCLATSEALVIVGRGGEAFAWSRGLFANPDDFAAAVALARRHVALAQPGRAQGKRLLTLFFWVIIFVALVIAWAYFQEGR